MIPIFPGRLTVRQIELLVGLWAFERVYLRGVSAERLAVLLGRGHRTIRTRFGTLERWGFVRVAGYRQGWILTDEGRRRLEALDFEPWRRPPGPRVDFASLGE